MTTSTTLPAADAWLIARWLAGASPATLDDLTSVLGQELKPRLAQANGHDRTAVLQAALQGHTDAQVIVQAIFATNLDHEPGATQPPGGRYHLRWVDTTPVATDDLAWIVEHLFSAGSVSLVFGEPGCGKTYTLLDASVCVARGLSWITFLTKQGPVLWIDEESGPRRFRKRLDEVMRAHAPHEGGTPIAYVCLAGFNLRRPADVEHVSTLVRDVHPVLIVVDALADVMPGGDENAVEDVQPVFLALRRVAEEAQAAVVVIHHRNKNGVYRGSSAIKGAVDLMLSVERQAEGGLLTFTTEKARDVEEFTFAARLCFDRETSTVKLAAPANSGTDPYRPPLPRRSPAELYVMHYLEKHGPSLVQEIVDHADVCSAGTARNAIYALARKLVVQRCDDGGHGTQALYRLSTSENEGAP